MVPISCSGFNAFEPGTICLTSVNVTALVSGVKRHSRFVAIFFPGVRSLSQVMRAMPGRAIYGYRAYARTHARTRERAWSRIFGRRRWRPRHFSWPVPVYRGFLGPKGGLFWSDSAFGSKNAGYKGVIRLFGVKCPSTGFPSAFIGRADRANCLTRVTARLLPCGQSRGFAPRSLLSRTRPARRIRTALYGETPPPCGAGCDQISLMPWTTCRASFM